MLHIYIYIYDIYIIYIIVRLPILRAEIVKQICFHICIYRYIVYLSKYIFMYIYIYICSLYKASTEVK